MNNYQINHSVSGKLSTLETLGISKNAQNKILASVRKTNTDNNKTEVSLK